MSMSSVLLTTVSGRIQDNPEMRSHQIVMDGPYTVLIIKPPTHANLRKSQEILGILRKYPEILGNTRKSSEIQRSLVD